MNTKQRVSAQRGEHLAVLAVNESAAIEFRCASLRRKIVTNNFGIREMSANVTPALGSICSSPFSPLRAGDGCRPGYLVSEALPLSRWGMRVTMC